ncbi:hypothetical protein RRF57_005933 [Xylaria bambusicola]|uniref:Uncharacterized protein n=1 Tax=Xylaria bambusicola TaxID=326684 RepID=A0AAN7Z8D8_9PEZI
MAELGATVISFLSLVKVIHRVHSAVGNLQNAPIEIRFFQDQLRSLDFIVGQVALMQKENGNTPRFEAFNEALAHVEKPLRQDIEALNALVQDITHKGKNTDGDNTALSAKLKFMYRSGQLEQIARRLGVHRDQLNTVLLVGQR